MEKNYPNLREDSNFVGHHFTVVLVWYFIRSFSTHNAIDQHKTRFYPGFQIRLVKKKLGFSLLGFALNGNLKWRAIMFDKKLGFANVLV